MKNYKGTNKLKMNNKESNKYYFKFFRKLEQKREKELDSLLVKKIREELELE